MNKLQSRAFALAAWATVLMPGMSLPAVAQPPSPAKSAPAMERTEHEWKGAERSSTFDAHWQGAELKMIREEMAPNAGMIEKNEFFFKAGALQHYKQDRYPASGKSGETVATMASFDKTGKTTLSMKRVEGRPPGPASAAEIADAKKHLAELLAITGKVKR